MPHYLLLGLDGAICATLRLAEGDPPRLWRVQMLDESGQPIPSPLADAAQPDFWIIDTHDPPEGFRLLETTAETWEEAAHGGGLKHYDGQEQKVKLRPGHTKTVEQPNAAVRCVHEEAVEQVCWAYGGIPVYRVKASSPRAELDFPALVFTHRPEWRKEPVTSFESAKAREKAQWLDTLRQQAAAKRIETSEPGPITQEEVV